MSCRMPFENLEIRTDGTVGVCCTSEFLIKDDAGRPVTVEQGLDFAVNQTSYLQFREAFNRGEKPTECIRCWNLEASSVDSKRTIENRRFSTTRILPHGKMRSLDLKLGNTCNLKCRICSSNASTRWIPDEIKLFKKSIFPATEWAVDEHSLDSLIPLLDQVEYIEFSGGEPFLIKSQFDFLLKIKEFGFSKQIDLHYHTNTSIFPEKHIKLLSAFKSVNIALSIDGIESRFEYLRTPASWSTCLENIRKFKQTPFDLSISHSIMSLNILYLPEFLFWLNDIEIPAHLNLVENRFGIVHLSDAAKETIAQTLDRDIPFYTRWQVNPVTRENNWIKNILMSRLGLNKNKFYLDKIAEVDIIRNQSYKDVFPEMFRLLNDK